MSEAERIFDLAVIGGGINGAGIAFDAAGRGARVLLLERGDLASGTSSASTKLIHGGLRYLEHGEFGLVREALAERERLWRMAPHCIQPLRFVLPLSQTQRPAWMIRSGLFLYDHLGARKLLPPTRTVRLVQHPAGASLREHGGRAFEYSDGWCDDSRLVILNARGAAERGATILPRHELTRAERHQDGWIITAAGRAFQARALVNAAGPGVASIIERSGHAGPPPTIRLVRGSHIVVPALFDHSYAYFFQLGDGRIFFALPYEGRFTLIGTTDVDHPSVDVPPRASEEEIHYLLNGANLYFRRSLGRSDVVWTFSGVRALVADASGKPEAATRGYRLDLSPAEAGAPLLNVFGGKITSYRQLAEKAVNLLAGRVPAIRERPWTANASLPGGDFPVEGLDELVAALTRDYPFITAADASRIGRAYGTDSRLWLAGARCWSDLGGQYGAGLSPAEVDFMVSHEWAASSDDILWRRSKLGLVLDAEGRRRLSADLKEQAA
ncbi:glycerol-3-phosphate dehydrogenase [Sphingomonas sp. BN140010]|uniref:Glycerol-3-phosphate dehydrogenase n=1 Tax=Sphingomonas arvum TaxID=2992113 RepID=A0ABT3JET0_9SPHN|nr:glycerol-3-phosphate dehydrogenase [Sphingomonas sp. BN140010]MCW3797583.1 glycerol-3-phosphate dehydrogenase [Sphingomonas sp. BN140010]